jgi:hypothetical protein
VTFDDLVVDNSVSVEALRDIVTAQLEVEAAQKPVGRSTPALGELHNLGRAP